MTTWRTNPAWPRLRIVAGPSSGSELPIAQGITVIGPLRGGADKWTPDGVARLLSILDQEAPVQAAVIRAAAANGGAVDRSRVFELGRYGPNRMLRGFTRPVSRVTRALQANGHVDLRAPDMLRPRYDYGVQANAFKIPEEVVQILIDPSTEH